MYTSFVIFSAARALWIQLRVFFFFLMIRRPPRSTLSSSSAASDVYKRQVSTQSTGEPTDLDMAMLPYVFLAMSFVDAAQAYLALFDRPTICIAIPPLALLPGSTVAFFGLYQILCSVRWGALGLDPFNPTLYRTTLLQVVGEAFFAVVFKMQGHLGEEHAGPVRSCAGILVALAGVMAWQHGFYTRRGGPPNKICLLYTSPSPRDS
eukprot:TRINITY_DN2760_c0_g1_i2.p1 TRINITY_DN2760_c0_g1~~TRINITY_DN2760_c0_g1_i2.p1  ORF type:complete len:207 (-),score=63.24 TRINITY_DN2760_c0_g1_i2:141-761(-)